MPKTAIKCSSLWGKKEEEGTDTSPCQPGVHVAEHGHDRAECNIIAMGRGI